MIRRPPRSTRFPTRRSSDLARQSFRLGGAVVDAAPRETLDTRRIQLPVGDAGRDDQGVARDLSPVGEGHDAVRVRSEEHTSELQSRQYLVCRLLLAKKKKTV